MNHPSPGDFIDIHNHGSGTEPGCFSVECLMAHEKREPDFQKGIAYSSGIHPWHLEAPAFDEDLDRVRRQLTHGNVIAAGEAGFDRMRGPGMELQLRAFGEQVKLSERAGKPLFIHCVRAWDHLLAAHRKMKPAQAWIIHGFRGKKELAGQLLSRGMFVSFWFDFVLRPESAMLVKSLPADRIFLETDGSGVGIGEIYRKVSSGMEIDIPALKELMYNNYISVFG